MTLHTLLMHELTQETAAKIVKRKNAIAFFGTFQIKGLGANALFIQKAFLHNITLKESKKQEIMETLLKGYQKQRKVEEIVAGLGNDRS